MGSDKAAPFDAVAAVYDRDFTDTAIGRMQRDLVWDQLAGHFGAGDRVLELGCGTGEDAVWMARRGIEVVATDASQAMLEQAEAKARAAGILDRVSFQRLDLARVENQAPLEGAPFDGVLSNFGALNCIADLRPLGRALVGWVRPGGRVALVVMGRMCAWEVAWFLVRLRPRAAFRRFRPGRPAGIGEGRSMPVWYPGPAQVRRDLGPCFQCLHTRAIGALVPSPDLNPVLGKRQRLLAALARLERPLAPALVFLADHYLISFERRDHA